MRIGPFIVTPKRQPLAWFDKSLVLALPLISAYIVLILAGITLPFSLLVAGVLLQASVMAFRAGKTHYGLELGVVGLFALALVFHWPT